GDAAYLAAVLDSYSSTATGAEPDELLASIAGRLVRFCTPQVAPPSVVVVSISPLTKCGLDRALADVAGVIRSPLRGFQLPASDHDYLPPTRFAADYSQRSQGP